MRGSHNKFISYCLIGAYNEGNFECSMGMGGITFEVSAVIYKAG